jgi:hypothetical protein
MFAMMLVSTRIIVAAREMQPVPCARFDFAAPHESSQRALAGADSVGPHNQHPIGVIAQLYRAFSQ